MATSYAGTYDGTFKEFELLGTAEAPASIVAGRICYDLAYLSCEHSRVRILVSGLRVTSTPTAFSDSVIAGNTAFNYWDATSQEFLFRVGTTPTFVIVKSVKLQLLDSAGLTTDPFEVLACLSLCVTTNSGGCPSTCPDRVVIA